MAKEEAEKTRVDIRAIVIEQGRGHRLVTSNMGKGAARDVTFAAWLADGGESFLIKSDVGQRQRISRMPWGR